MNMTPLDYGQSFLLGKGAANEVRFVVESRTRVIDQHAGVAEDYLQCASCKSEDTFAERDLFYEDNYDFLPIFGPDWAVVFRRKASLNDGYRETRTADGFFGGQDNRLVEGRHVKTLATPADVLGATYACTPIVAQTEIHNEATGLRAIIEYPVKTMNTRRADQAYQIDTGPIALPDLSRREERLIDLLSLAFVAFNAPHFADFVIEAPTEIAPAKGDEAVRVWHYSKRVSLPAENRLYGVG